MGAERNKNKRKTGTRRRESANRQATARAKKDAAQSTSAAKTGKEKSAQKQRRLHRGVTTAKLPEINKRPSVKVKIRTTTRPSASGSTTKGIRKKKKSQKMAIHDHKQRRKSAECKKATNMPTHLWRQADGEYPAAPQRDKAETANSQPES